VPHPPDIAEVRRAWTVHLLWNASERLLRRCRLGTETLATVPERELGGAPAHFRFDASVSRDLASSVCDSCSSSAQGETVFATLEMFVAT
jgi:hypothetical protein